MTWIFLRVECPEVSEISFAEVHLKCVELSEPAPEAKEVLP